MMNTNNTNGGSTTLSMSQQQQQQQQSSNNNNCGNTANDLNVMMKQWKPQGGQTGQRTDSLLGMASSLLDVDMFRSMLRPPPPSSLMSSQHRQQQQQRQMRPEEITSQVLAELSDDLFSDSCDLFGSDDLEPIPVNPNRMNVVDSFQGHQQQQQRQPSRYSLMEGTLSQVLNNNNNSNTNSMMQMMQSQPNITSQFGAPHHSSLPQVTTNTPDVTGSNSLKRLMASSSATATAFTDLPPFKKQRTASDANEVVAAEDGMGGEDDPRRFRPYQAEQWTEKFEELVQFRKEKGHCCVPHTYKENPALARWVKRQRYQYKLKNECKQSTMTDERVEALEQIGFIWDSHGAAWAERLNELKDYQKETGHCNVPSNYPSNPQLATWVKCQRRQYKLFWDGKTSNMTLQRISGLEEIGFEWELRTHTKSSTTSADNNNNNNNNVWSM